MGISEQMENGMPKIVALSALALILTVSLTGAELGSRAIGAADWDVNFQAAVPPDSAAAARADSTESSDDSISLQTIGFPEKIEYDSVAVPDSTAGAKNFRLLEADSYTLDMHYSSALERLIVGIQFSLPKAELDPSKVWGMFIHRNAVINSISVSGEYEQPGFWANLTANDFQPLLPIPGLLAKDAQAVFFNLSLENYASYADSVQFEIWYTLSTPPFAEGEQSVLSTGFEASQFWYPRRLSGPSRLNIRLSTAPDINLLLGGSYAPHSSGRYSWDHEIVISENPEQPVSLVLIKNKQLN